MSNYIKNKSIITMRVWLFILCSLVLCLSGCSSKSKSSDTFIPEIEPIIYPYQLEESPDSFKVFVEVSSKENYFFNMYDMEIKIDGYEIGTVSNGKLFTKMLYLPEGYHEISLCKVGKNKPNTSDYFKVDEDMTYECSVAHRKAKIEFKGVQTKYDVEDAREVEIEDYSGMTFTKAKSILKEEGFSNISILGQSDTSGKDKWIVVNQNKPKGNSVCIMDSIVLDCIPTDEYVAQTFSGKSVSEIIEWAEYNEIELGYKKYRNDKELDISKYADFEKKEWKIIQSSFDTKKGNIMLMVSRGYDEAEDIIVEVVETEEKPQETAVETKETSTQTAEQPQATEQTQQAEQPQTTPEKQTTEVPKQESEKQTTEKPKEEIVIPASFDPEFYATHNPDVVAACGNSPEELYKHYQNYGKKEGRSQNAEEEAAKLAKLQEQPQPEPEPTPQITEQPQPQPEPQPQPQTPSAGSGDGRVCYITPSGKRWHLDKECAGKNAIQTTVGEAKQNPRITGPCGVCAKYE